MGCGVSAEENHKTEQKRKNEQERQRQRLQAEDQVRLEQVLASRRFNVTFQHDGEEFESRVLPEDIVVTASCLAAQVFASKVEVTFGGNKVPDGETFVQHDVEEGALLHVKVVEPLPPLTNDTIRVAVKLWCHEKEKALCSYGPIGRWNVREVTDMHNLFMHESKFNDDISTWQVKNVTNMSGMFFGASSFNKKLETWNVSHLQCKLDGMFLGATAIEQLPLWYQRFEEAKRQ